MKRVCFGLVFSLVIAACSSGDSTTEITSKTSVVPESTSAPSTTTALATTTTEATTTTMSFEEAISFEIVEQTETFTRLVISDTSGRNVSDESLNPVETLNPRGIYVTVKRALNRDQTLITDRAVPLAIAGVYHTNGDANCLFAPVPIEQTVACVGFPYMDNSKYTRGTYPMGDLPNHTGDVSRTLDVLFANPGLTSDIDPERVYYFGASMGGVTGFMFVAPDFREERLKAIISFIGASPFWFDELDNKDNFDAAPPLLMVNKMNDTVITYEYAKLSFAAAHGSPRVEMVSVFEGDHIDPMTCPAAQEFQFAWLDHHLNGGPPPDRAALDDSGCAAFGPQEGGTTGWGAANLPDEAKALFTP